MVPSPAESEVMTALGAFLLDILPAGVDVIQAQVNRTPEPAGDDFVIMTPRSRMRLETNTDAWEDSIFTASIAGTLLSVTDVDSGVLAVGAVVSGSGVIDGTKITALGSGVGGTGTYVVSDSQSVASQLMSAGGIRVLTPTEITVQLDVHGPNGGDNAQVIMALMRDPYAVKFFEDNGDAAVPLYSEDPRQMPFTNEQQQYEDRWVVEVCLQTNERLLVPQQFGATVSVDLVSVEVEYPPA